MLIILIISIVAAISGHRSAFIDGDVIRRRLPVYATNIRTQSRQAQSFLSHRERDTNPELFGSVGGFPGIELRFNQRAFQYASVLVSPIIGDEIKRTRLSPVTQCIQQLNGCITLYNLYIARFRCPQRVYVYPTPPNRIIVTAQNLDIGISGNVGGNIHVLLPITLSGIVHISAHQVSVTTQLSIRRSSDGSPYVRLFGCYVSIGFADVIVQNGGLVGDIFNSQFRAKAADQVRSMIPVKICEVLPLIIATRVNKQLRTVPLTVPLRLFTKLVENIFNDVSTKNLPEHCYSVECRDRLRLLDAITHISGPPRAHGLVEFSTTKKGKQLRSSSLKVQPRYLYKRLTASSSPQYRRVHRITPSSTPKRRIVRQVPCARAPPSYASSKQLKLVTIPTNRRVFTRAVSQNPLDPCADCSPTDLSGSTSPWSTVTKTIDMNKLSDIALNMQFQKSLATANDYTISMNGEFSPSGRGGTPFNAFPMHFPRIVGIRMVEILISDFTINSLFYYMYKRDFITFRIGPETPKFGELLKTTCGDEDYDDFEDPGVETDEEEETTSNPSTTRRKKRAAVDDDDKETSLADLGVCLGDIMPAVREKFPKKLLYIIFRASQAPVVILSGRTGGVVSINMIAEADFYIDGTNEKVGSIEITGVLDATIKVSGNHITGVAMIRTLKLSDKRHSLGLTQDALDNLANLSKEVFAKMANDALVQGFLVQLPTSKLPMTFVEPELRVVDHALYIASDFTVSPSTLGITSNSICKRF